MPSPQQPPVPAPSIAPPARALNLVEAMLGQVTVERDGLPVGTAVGSFVLHEVVERDEFSLTYRAASSASASEVLIEEYWPSALASRSAAGGLVVRDASQAALFEGGLEAFVGEAEQLAQIGHPALVRMGPVWRARGTAYRLRFEQPGALLSQVLASSNQPPSEAWLRALTEPLLGALECLHEAGRVHGNVRPDRIVVQPDGSPLLLDFGAVRAGLARTAPWCVERPDASFAAPELELYGAVPTAAADLYSLAAVLHHGVTGVPPVPHRGAERTQPGVLGAALDGLRRRHPSVRYSQGWVAAIDRALSFDPAERPQSVAEFRADLARPSAPGPAAAEPPTSIVAAAAGAEPAGRVEPSTRWPVDEGSEPLWHWPLERAADAPPALTDVPILTDRELAPPATAVPASAGPAAGAFRPLPLLPRPNPRRWPWVAVGAVGGAAAMLAVSLGIGRLADDVRVARLIAGATAHGVEGVAPADRGAPVVARTAEPMVPARSTAASGNAAAARPASDPVPSPAPVPALAAATYATTTTTGEAVPSPTAGAVAAAATAARAVPREPREPRATVQRKQPAAQADPIEACAPRTNFALYQCLKTQCLEAHFYAHPTCVVLRRTDEMPAPRGTSAE